MALGNVTNNAGNLLASANTLGFQGVTGTTQANGLGYLTFDNASSGVRALAIDLKNAIAGGYNTLTALIAHYLGNPVKNGVIQPTSANPNPGNYLSTVEQVSGLGANSSLSSANVVGIAQGIIKAEGSTVDASSFNTGISRAGLGGTPQVTQAQNQFGGALGSMFNDFNTGATYIGQNGVGAGANVFASVFAQGSQAIAANPLGSGQSLLNSFTSGVTTTSQAAADTSSQAITAAGASVAGAISGIQAFAGNLFSSSNLTRVVLVVVGILLLAAAVFTLSKSYGGQAAPALKALAA